MKAEDIRKLSADRDTYYTDSLRLFREIAAQLAELNENIKRVAINIDIAGDKGDPR
jgi:hypothetical protein